MSNLKAERLNKVFRALADPTRREMIRQIALHERTVTELAAPFQMSLEAASKHIRVLEDAGLLHRTIQGRKHMCRLEPAALSAASEWIRFYESFWNEQFDALERELSMSESNSEDKGPSID